MRTESLIPATDITAFYETNRSEVAETYIRLGWLLLETITKQEEDEGYTHYLLGWPGADPPHVPCANYFIKGARGGHCFCNAGDLVTTPKKGVPFEAGG